MQTLLVDLHLIFVTEITIIQCLEINIEDINNAF